MSFTRIVAALRNLRHGHSRDRDLDQELHAYVDLLVDEQVAGGTPPDEAARIARLKLGGVEQVKEHVREGRAGHTVERALQDLRYGARLLRRSPAFAVVAILTLALGIGANTAIFSVLYTVLFKPLPYPDADRVIRIVGSNLSHGWNEISLSHANFWDIADQSRAFEAIGAMRGNSVSETGVEYPERLAAPLVSPGFFRALGLQPLAGRFFEPGQARRGGDTHVVVLSQRLWSRRFGRDPRVIGRTLVLDGEPHRVIGVAPSDTVSLGEDAFLPLVRTGNEDRGSFELLVVARLKQGITLDRARADLDRIAASLARSFPQINAGLGLIAIPSSAWLATDGLRRSLWLLMGAVSLLLVIACVNLSNMLLARAAGRARETALRSALGATRQRLVNQMLCESLLLSAIGAVVGVVLAVSVLAAVRSLEIDDVPRLSEVTINGWALAFTALVMIVTTVLIAIVPALQLPTSDLVPALRDGERSVAGTGVRRVRTALVVAEVALSMTLLIGAGLLLRSLDAVLRVDRGFRTEDRVFIAVSLPLPYQTDKSGDQAAAFLSELVRRTRQLPGVFDAAAVSGRPLVPDSTGLGIARPGANASEVPWATWRLVSREYFHVMGIPLLRGRTFLEGERMGTEMRVVISKRVADLLWPGQDPIGRRIVLWKGQGDPQAEIVGVVADMRERGLATDPTLAVYFPYYGTAWTPIQVVVHTTNSPERLMALLRAAVAGIDPTTPISDAQTVEQIVSASVASRRMIAGLLGSFAVLAFVLAIVGVYGVLSYVVARRTAEIGVRVALGASTASVIRLIMLQGLRPVFAGLVLGVIAALSFSRVVTTLLFGISPADPLTYVAIGSLLAAAAALACAVPAWQAARIEVTNALRVE